MVYFVLLGYEASAFEGRFWLFFGCISLHESDGEWGAFI